MDNFTGDKRYSGYWEDVPKLLENIKRPEFKEKEYNISDYGAVGDGSTNCYQAFKAAIQECTENGGGKVVVPAGTFLVHGPIHLEDNVNLHLASQNSCIKFGTNPEDYLVGKPEFKGCVLTSWEGTRLYNYSPSIYARDKENIGITGCGTIDQQGTESWFQWRPLQKEDRILTREMNNKGTPLKERIFGPGHYLRPHFIQLYQCENIIIEGITIKDCGFWMIHPVFCKNVTIQEISFESNNLNNDGIDPDSSSHVLIKDINFNNGDDNISIKAGRDREALELGIPCKYVLIQNCSFKAYNAVAIGSEMSGGVSDIYVENCTFGGEVRSAIYIKSNQDRGGEIDKIRIRNLEFGQVSKNGIYINTNYKKENKYNRSTYIHDILIQNVTIEAVNGYAIYLEGLSDQPVETVILENIKICQARENIHKDNIENLVMNNVSINGKNN